MEPDVDRNVRLAWEAGYLPVNERFAEAVAAEIEELGRRLAGGDGARLPAVHGAARRARARAASAVIQHFTHIPWPMPDYWRVLPDRHPQGHPRVAAGLRHRRAAHRSLRARLPAVLRRADRWRGRLRRAAPSASRGATCRCAPTRSRSTRPSSSGWRPSRRGDREEEPRVLQARPEKMILRVDRTDPSKNVVRGFRAFDLFLLAAPRVARPGDDAGAARPVPAGDPRVRRVRRRDPAGRARGERPLVHDRHVDADRPAHLRQLPARRWPPTSTTTCCW